MSLSTPMLWIFLPLIVAGISGFFYQRRVLSIILTSLTAFGLALLAGFFPEDLTLIIGPLELTFQESFGFLGRQITTPYDMLPLITMIFGLTGLWLLGSASFPKNGVFRSLALVVVSLLVAALGVEPFLYAALLIETTVLVTIPMLSPMGQKPERGILRYLSLQTLAMPFILLAGWLLSGVEVLTTDSELVNQMAITLGLGFAIWLSIFPFHSWIPMVSAKSSPLAASFLFFIMPTTILFFGLNFIDRYALLRESNRLYEILRFMGTLTIVLSGIWTAFQSNLKRAFGFSALTETGFLILAVGLNNQDGLMPAMMLIPIRAVGLWIWGYLLMHIEKHFGELTLDHLSGGMRRLPLLSSGLLLAQLSMAGFPLLASFPIKIALFSTLSRYNPGIGVWTFLGNLGLFLFTIRLLGALIKPLPEKTARPWKINEKTYEYLPLLLIILFLLFLGLFPQVVLSKLTLIAQTFTHLQ